MELKGKRVMILVDQAVGVDGKLITSRKPDDLPAFMKAIIDSLKGCPPSLTMHQNVRSLRFPQNLDNDSCVRLLWLMPSAQLKV